MTREVATMWAGIIQGSKPLVRDAAWALQVGEKLLETADECLQEAVRQAADQVEPVPEAAVIAPVKQTVVDYLWEGLLRTDQDSLENPQPTPVCPKCGGPHEYCFSKGGIKIAHKVPPEGVLTEEARRKFESKFRICPTSGCHLWTDATSGFGYGSFYFAGHRFLAHRYSWWLYRRTEIPSLIAHKCDVPACVNPEHLFLATPQENFQDCLNKGRHPGCVAQPAEPEDRSALFLNILGHKKQ